MKRALLGAALLALLGAGPPRPGTEQDPAIRVLLTTGGHGFEEKPFYAMFDAMPGVAVTKASLPKEADRLKPGLEKEFDVIVRYDMVPKVTPGQRQAFLELMKTSGIGLVSLHHNMGAHRDWDDYKSIIGAKFIFKPCEIEGKAYTKSGWSHGEDLDIAVVDRDHPITQGVQDFKIHDETYNKYYVASDAKLLLKTDHPKNDPQIAWVREFGKSRVFYFMLGHDHFAYENPNFRRILLQGIRWAARK